MNNKQSLRVGNYRMEVCRITKVEEDLGIVKISSTIKEENDVNWNIFDGDNREYDLRNEKATEEFVIFLLSCGCGVYRNNKFSARLPDLVGLEYTLVVTPRGERYVFPKEVFSRDSKRRKAS